MSAFKVLRVTYYHEDVFKIPPNIDLENKEQVKSYGVKWNVLYIDLTNGKTIKVDSEGWECDMKYPGDEEIFDNEDIGNIPEEEFEDADLELDEEEEKKQEEEKQRLRELQKKKNDELEKKAIEEGKEVVRVRRINAEGQNVTKDNGGIYLVDKDNIVYDAETKEEIGYFNNNLKRIVFNTESICEKCECSLTDESRVVLPTTELCIDCHNKDKHIVSISAEEQAENDKTANQYDNWKCEKCDNKKVDEEDKLCAMCYGWRCCESCGYKIDINEEPYSYDDDTGFYKCEDCDDCDDNWCECSLCGKELTNEKSVLTDYDGATICVCVDCGSN